jgi:hypothetical protein
LFVPANLTAENNGGFLTVRWEASTDDFAPQAETVATLSAPA